MATVRVSSGDGSSAAAVESFLRAAAFVLPDPLPLPRCLFSPLDPRASDSQLYQRLRRFVASPLYQRLRRFVASPLYQRIRRFVASPLYQRTRRFVASSLRRFVASSLRRFVASSLRRFVASLHLRFCGLCGVLLQLLGVSRSVCIKVRGFCGVRGVKVRGFRDVLQLSRISVAWVSRSGGSVVFEVSRSGGQVGV
jgi:hypothetical protein